MRSFLKGVATTVVALAVIWVSASLADYTILDSTSTTRTVKAFVCETTKICNAHVPIKSDGTEIFTSGAPAQVSLANTAANTNKLLVTPDSVALPANQSVNVSQINAVTPLMGNGVTGTGSPRVTIASDNTAFSVNVANANTNGVAVSANSSPVVIASDQVAVAVKAASGTIASGAVASGAFASGALASGSVASGAFASGAFATGSFLNATAADPCMFQNKTNLAISQNGTSSVQLIPLSGSTVIYVCSLSIIAAGATTVAFTTGTGSACVTGNAAVIGSTTANIANSLSFAANGGLTLGNGGNTIAKGAASSELCMINGSNVFVSGNLTYVQQ